MAIPSKITNRAVPIFFFLLLLVVPASATPIFTPVAGNLVVNRIISGEGELFDIRGQLAVEVFEDSVSLGPILLTDIESGTDPDFEVLPFGNTTLFGLPFDFTQATGIVFDFVSPIVGPTSLQLNAIGVSMFPEPVTIPALLYTTGLLEFDFTLSNLIMLDNMTVATYDFAGMASVPEPATAGLVLLGISLLGLAGFRRRK